MSIEDDAAPSGAARKASPRMHAVAKAVAQVTTPLCLSFFFEFGVAVYKPTQASLNEATFGKSGEYFYC